MWGVRQKLVEFSVFGVPSTYSPDLSGSPTP